MDTITWSDRVKLLRRDGMTLARIGRAIGITPQGVCDIEQGRTKEPSGMTAVRLYTMSRRRERQRE